MHFIVLLWILEEVVNWRLINMGRNILISCAFWNMGETSLAVEIAKNLKSSNNVIFFSFGGDYEYVVENERFKIIHLKPMIDKKKTRHLYEIDRCEKFGSYFTIKEIREQVISELELFDTIHPDAIISALNFSSFISARIAKIPLFSIGHSTWLCETATRIGKVNIFNSDKYHLNDVQVILTKIMAKLYIKNIISPYNCVMKSYNLKSFKGYEEWWSGDYTIMTEPEGFVEDLNVLTPHFYTGAIYADLKGEVPFDMDEIRKNYKDKKIIYFAMGSSGILKIIKNIILELSLMQDYIFITPMQKKIEELGIKKPKNFIITDWIPTKDVLPLFDAAIIHGGLGTVFSTINAEIPFISIPMHAEQELNADYCVDKKICLKVQPFNSSIRKRLKNHLIEITNNEIYKINITKYAEKVRSKRNVQRLDEFIEQSIAKYKGEI